MAPDAPESFRIPKFQTATWDQMCSGPLGHCEALVTNIAKRRHLLQSVTALSPWTAKIEATDEVHWPSRVLRWGTETSTTMAKNSTSTSTRSRTRPSGSFIWFHIIIHVFAPTLVDFGWPFFWQDMKHVPTLNSEQLYFAAKDLSYCPVLRTLPPSKSAEPKYTMMTPNPMSGAWGILTLTHHAPGCKGIANSTFPNHWEARRTAVHGNSSVPTLAYRSRLRNCQG